eukprot:g17348.t1
MLLDAISSQFWNGISESHSSQLVSDALQDWGDARDASGRRWRKVVDVRSCPIATEARTETLLALLVALPATGFHTTASEVNMSEAPKKSYEEVHGKIPAGPVIDSKGLAVQTGSGAPRERPKKTYEEVHGKMPGGPVIDEEGLAVQSTGEPLSKEASPLR